ncbi:MAG: penicillin-binding protein activator LpoB [Elusimicrobium sp.]|jgi:uncharacterized protein (TIGR02722 family)|nr:penicillin-binding protein activator LpoB [Elusimicrobium sp.]
MKKIILLMTAATLCFGCSTKVQRMDTNTTRDLSGRWNDTDSRLVAEEMINDSLSNQWYDRFLAQNGREPVVIVGTVENQSMEHINTRTFIENIQRALINSGKVKFVASREERGEIRTERLEQDEFASVETRRAFGREVGADFMLNGVLTSIVDREGRRSVVFYQTNLRLINIETNQIVWNGEKQIKKYILSRGSRL